MADEIIDTDEELARKVQAGDSSAFGEIMVRYEARLTRYGRRYLARVEDIEDVIQDVFLKTYENIQSYNSDYRFSPWIYRIAHNAFVNVLRKQKHRTFEFFDFDTLVSPLSFTQPKESEAESSKLQKIIESTSLNSLRSIVRLLSSTILRNSHTKRLPMFFIFR